MADGGDSGAGKGGGSLHFPKKDSSKAICVIQVYFSGSAVIAWVLTLNVISNTTLRNANFLHRCDICHVYTDTYPGGEVISTITLHFGIHCSLRQLVEVQVSRASCPTIESLGLC